MHPYTLTMSICYNNEIPQNGAGMYPSRDVTFNYCVGYVRVKRPITDMSFVTLLCNYFVFYI